MGTSRLYVATDNAALVTQNEAICGKSGGNRKCFFASNFTKFTDIAGLKHFQQINALDYLVYGGADYLSTTKESTFGDYIQRLHIQIKQENFLGSG